MLKAAIALTTTVTAVVVRATARLLRMLISRPSRWMTRTKFTMVGCRGK